MLSPMPRTLPATLPTRWRRALSAAIAARGAASIAVSGGSTPKAFFQALSNRDLDWSKVTVTLVDERFVPADNERSNHLLVASNLLQNKAKAARFVPLYRKTGSAEDAAKLATAETKAIGNPFDVVILGMGGDGHTASFFPGGNNLAVALDPATPRGVITMEARGCRRATPDLHLLQPSGCRAPGAPYRRRRQEGRADESRRCRGRGRDANSCRSAAGGLAGGDILGTLNKPSGRAAEHKN